jgi:hypothetical protein
VLKSLNLFGSPGPSHPEGTTRGKFKLVQVANALSAFSDVQALFDPMQIGSPPPRKA